MADEQRTVSVSLQLLYDPRSGRAFQQMAKEAEKAAKAANSAVVGEFAKRDQALSAIGGTASNLGMYGTANRLGRVGAFAEGMQGLGFNRGAAMLQRAALPLAIAGGLANAGEKVAGYAYDAYSTNSQIGRQFVRDLLPGGERAQRFVDALSGRGAGMEQAGITGQYGAAAAQARTERMQFGLQFNPRIAAAGGTAEAFRRQSAVAPSVFDRTTSEGERRYREEQRILPLKQAEAKAERDAASATKERVSLQSELTKISGRSNELTRERQRLERELGREENQSGVKRQNVLKQIENVNAEIGSTLSLQKGAAEGLVGARQKEAGAGGELTKARLRTRLLGEAETLEGRVETAQAAAEKLGGMTPFDRAYGLYAARIVKERGSTEGLPDDILSAAQNFAPSFVQSVARKTGAGTAEFKEGFAEFGAADFGTTDIGGDSTRAQELRRQLAEGEFKIDAGVADKILNSFSEVGRQIGEIIEQGLQRQRSEILNVVRLGRNT